MTDKMILKGRLDGSQRMRLGKLLDMLYMPSELAAQIGFTVRQVYRVYVPFGCPCSRDSENRLWINGKVFAEWYEATYPKPTLQADEAFCLTCKKPVLMKNTVKSKKGRLSYLVGNCFHCGRKIARILDKDKLYDKSK
jgi:hypothetical protein